MRSEEMVLQVKSVVFIIYVALTFLVFKECESYNVVTPLNFSRYKRQATAAKCSSRQFKCNSGLCIPRAQLCDGKADCADVSDETIRCHELTGDCPDYAFKCAYGACVDGDAECNGVQDCVDNSDENTKKCPKDTNTDSKCGKKKFTCNNGECIDNFSTCDGKKDCSDGSDETFTTCSKQFCVDFAFRCAYGACVDGDARCNGKVECADGSDEIPEICGSTGPVTQSPPTTQSSLNGGCVLPPTPTNGMYSIPGLNIALVPGQAIESNSFLSYDCNKGYALYPLNGKFLICSEGQWDKPIPNCVKTCPPRISESVEIKCELDNLAVDCTKPMLEGTFVTMKCKHLYEQVQSSISPIIRCKDGSWDFGLIKCFPECGKIVPKGQQFVVGGESAKKGDFPWHVGIYRKQNEKVKHICGGSLINPKVVISAAHCFTEEYSGKKYPENDFLIAGGKYYREYNDKRDTYAQNSTIKQILVHEDYKAILSSFGSDIAIVVLLQPFKITHVVQPVCVDWNNDYEDNQLTPGNQGAVVGWGYTKEGSDPSDDLKVLRVPYIDRGKCFEVVPEDFYVYLTTDKICAGFTNGSSVCQGDSGGGLVFYQPDNKRYYIRGVVSVGPIKGDSCDSRQYGAYTKVSKFIDFVSRAEVLNRPE